MSIFIMLHSKLSKFNYQLWFGKAVALLLVNSILIQTFAFVNAPVIAAEPTFDLLANIENGGFPNLPNFLNTPRNTGLPKKQAGKKDSLNSHPAKRNVSKNENAKIIGQFGDGQSDLLSNKELVNLPNAANNNLINGENSLVSPAESNPGDPNTLAQFSITGKIVFKNLYPLSGLTVLALDNANVIASSVTNSEGDYQLNVPEGRNYLVSVKTPGFIFSPPSQVFNNLASNQLANFTATATNLSISEFRFRGKNGVTDEFIEIYNNSDEEVDISGFSIVSSENLAVPKFTAPGFALSKTTTIPARGHFLVAGKDYSLNDYAAPDGELNSDIPDNAGIGLFVNSTNFSINNRVDAVGFSGVDSLFREGAGLVPISGITADKEFSFFRNFRPYPSDTDNNAVDFALVSTEAEIINDTQTILGAPGPENRKSPIFKVNDVIASVLDPGAGLTSAPNQVEDKTKVDIAPLGTIASRRTFTNKTELPINKLRIRVIGITTVGSPRLYNPQAIVKVLSSADINITKSDNTTVLVKGLTIESPNNPSKGGGLNTSLIVNLEEPINPNESVNVDTLLGSISSGRLVFNTVVEAGFIPRNRPPEINVINPINEGVVSAGSLSLTGTVTTTPPDMPVTLTINGRNTTLAGNEFSETVELVEGINTFELVATDSLNQRTVETIRVTNSRSPISILLQNVPQLVTQGESYTIDATVQDTTGGVEVEFVIDGQSIQRTNTLPYQLVLNIPENEPAGKTINLSAIARNSAGSSAIATAKILTTGPSGGSGYVFDDTTGYILTDAIVKVNNETSINSNNIGLYSFISRTSNGNVLISKAGYTGVERGYSTNAGSGIELFDARLTPIDSKSNVIGENGNLVATSTDNTLQVIFAPNSLPSPTDIRVTGISPQGLANLLPYGWSPIPETTFDIRRADEIGFSNINLANPALVKISQLNFLGNTPLVLAYYDSSNHSWFVVQNDVFIGQTGEAQFPVLKTGQYTLLMPDFGATAPPPAVVGQKLPNGRAANSEALNSATASALANPATSLFSPQAKARISFMAVSPSKLPSGTSIEASFNDTYLPIIDRNLVYVERPSQDFILYSYPAATESEPNKLGAYFVAKPVRMDYSVTDLINAKVQVDIRSGRLSQSGSLIGEDGGIIRGEEDSEIEIPAGALSETQVIFFDKMAADQVGISLPNGFEIVGAFGTEFSGSVFAQSARISTPSVFGDNSKIVVVRVISVNGQQSIKLVGRAIERNGRLESTIETPIVPNGVNLYGIRETGTYLFIRIPTEFGYITGTANSNTPNQNIKVSNNQTPFIDVVRTNETYTLLGYVNNMTHLVDGVALNGDATGNTSVQIQQQDAVAEVHIQLNSEVLSVQSVSPNNGETGVNVSTPIVINFNKPIQTNTITASNVKLVTETGNPVITTSTISANGRTVTLTPSSNLIRETNYKVQITPNVKDIYGNNLPTQYESTFRTPNVVLSTERLDASKVRIMYPNAAGTSIIAIPVGAVPSGTSIFVINNTNGSTISTITGSIAINLSIQARVGDEIDLIIKQPDGFEYTVKQAVYIREDGFSSVGVNGGTLTSADGTIVLRAPKGAISGQAEVKISSDPESAISIPREGVMDSTESTFVGGVKFEVQGLFSNTQELHLEMPAPANVQDGDRGLVMRPSKITVDGIEKDSWQTVTSAKIENGKVKTTSPPFAGLQLSMNFASSIITQADHVYVIVGRQRKAVTGFVQRQQKDGSLIPVRAGYCHLANRDTIYGPINNDSKFVIPHNEDNNSPLNIVCNADGESKTAVAYPYALQPADYGLQGFATSFANVIFPASSLDVKPQLIIQGGILDNADNPLPDDEDSLKRFGRVQIGRVVYLQVIKIPQNTQFVSQDLFINGVKQPLNLNCNSLNCGGKIPAPTAGRYTVSITARTVLSNPNTEETFNFNFVVLENPSEKHPIYGVKPTVIKMTPVNGSEQIDVGSTFKIEFSEPVKNLAKHTVFIEGNGEIIEGVVYSAGIPIDESVASSSIEFIPNKKLESGKIYHLKLTDAIIDICEGDPNAVPPIPPDPDSLRRLDFFTSNFTTFKGGILTERPIDTKATKIGAVDDYIVTAESAIQGQTSHGRIKLYDFTDIVGKQANQFPEPPEPIVDSYFPQVPFGMTVKKQTLVLDDVVQEIPVIAVTGMSMEGDGSVVSIPRNVWFFTITEEQTLRLIGVVSLVANSNLGQVPNKISIENNRAYIGSSTNGGVYVVDIQRAIYLFKEQDNTPNDGNEFNTKPVYLALAQVNPPVFPIGFGQLSFLQQVRYKNLTTPFRVYGLSTTTQFGNPITYVASEYNRLIGFNLSPNFDGGIGYSEGAEGKDSRVIVDEQIGFPLSFSDIKTTNLQTEGATRTIAIGASDRLILFDITTPQQVVQYPRPLPNEPQKQPEDFAKLGVPVSFGTIARQIEIEDSLAYVMFDNGMGVFDISNPNEPYLTTLINDLRSLKDFAVQDGFIYAISGNETGNNGINIAIGRGVAQVITYGYDPNSPDELCGNPVVLSKNENRMVQPAGIFFQSFGHNVPDQAGVIIRKIRELPDGNKEEIVVGNVSAAIERFEGRDGMKIVYGKAIWSIPEPIDRSSIYTAELYFNDQPQSKQVEIPFSNLIPDNLFQKEIHSAESNSSNGPTPGALTYLLAGNALGVSLRIGNEVVPVFRNKALTEGKDQTRPFGSNVDYLNTKSFPIGIHPFTFKADLKANPLYSEEISGVIRIGINSDKVRQPGSIVVNGVEVNSGNLAVSETDVYIKGRGLSLDLTRSYNSQSMDQFGTFGYGWSHSYQISLVHHPGDGYKLIGGEGGGQYFKEANLRGNEIQAEAPYLGRLVKNGDGSFDYFTKTQVKYHFIQPFESGSSKIYLGNLQYIEEPNKNRITFSYDASQRLASVTDSSGRRKLIFEYEGANNIFTGIDVGENITTSEGCIKSTNFRKISKKLDQSVSGKAWRIKRITSENLYDLALDYTYDEFSNLRSVTRNGAPTAEKVWEYTYNPTPSKEERYNHLLEGIKPPNRTISDITKYTYHLSATEPPRVNQIIMPVTPENIINTFSYQLEQNLVKRATFTDGNGNPTEYNLDNFGRVATINAPLGAITQLTWTDFGQIKNTIDPEGKTTDITYDANNNPWVQTVSGVGETITTTTVFDQKFSKMSSYTDGNGNATSYSINQTTGNVDKITLPNGREIRFSYFANGDLRENIDQYGTVTSYRDYDDYGNPQTITKTLGSEQQIVTQTFDDRSRQISSSDNLGVNVINSYDNLDNVISKTTTDPTNYRQSITTTYKYLPGGQITEQLNVGGDQEYKIVNSYDNVDRVFRTTETVSRYAQPFIRNFTYDENSNLLTETNRRGIQTVNTYNALNHLTKTEQGGKTIWNAISINKVGNPTKVSDLYGNETEYTYDGLQRIVSKKLPTNVTETISYDKNNNILSSTDRNGKITTNTYDSQNRLETITDALGRIVKLTYLDATHEIRKEVINKGLIETTKYDGLERPLFQTITGSGINGSYTTAYEYAGRNVRITDPKGIVTIQKLSGFGEVGELEIEGSTPFYKVQNRYSAFGAVSQSIDALGRINNFVNDGFNRPISANYNAEFIESWVYDGEGLLIGNQNKRGVASTIEYDELGRKTSTKVNGLEIEQITYQDANSIELYKDANGFIKTVKYDGLRRVVQLINAAGDFKNYVYDGENLIEESDFYDRRTRYLYDAINRLREVFDRQNGHTLIAYSADDLTKTITDKRGFQGIERYDALGRLLEFSKAGKVVSYTYDSSNNRLTEQNGLNYQTTYTYDNLDRLRTITHPGNLQTETFTYDAVGNLLTHHDGRGGTTESLRYDSLNQLEEAKDEVGNITKFDYDGEGLLLSVINPKGEQTSYTYNALGSMETVSEPGQGTWQFTYDNAQNLISTRDPLGRITSNTYDELHRLTQTTQPLNKVTAYTYNKNSGVTSVIDPLGQEATMTYDELDRVSTVSYKDSGNSERLYQSYNYDAEGNLWQVVERRNDQNRTYRREYDARNRITKTTDFNNRSVTFGYDLADNLTSLTDANNSITNYTYNSKSEVVNVTKDGTLMANYDWYADGLLQKVTYSSNAKREYTYDSADRITNVTNTLGANAESFDYGYDANSNRISEIKRINNQAYRTISYEFDQVDRLSKTTSIQNVAMPIPPINSEANYNENSIINNYSYDQVGNRLAENKQTITKKITLRTSPTGETTRTDEIQNTVTENISAVYNDLNQLTQLNENGVVSEFNYDNNGNLLNIQKNNITIASYEYDVRDQMVSAKNDAGTEVARFDYDFEKKRISKRNDQITTNYVYAGYNVINELKNNNLAASYTIGAGEIVRGDFETEGGKYYYTDAQGSVTSLSDTAGTLTNRSEYDAFGQIIGSTGATANKIGYTGQRLDSETGLMALGNGERYYSPAYARFIQQDSFSGTPNIPQSLNRYAYAHNNPLKHTDPSGNVVPFVAWGIAAIGGLLTANSVVTSYESNNIRGNAQGWALDDERRNWTSALSDGIGATKVLQAGFGWEVYEERSLSRGERAWQGTLGTLELGLNIFGAAKTLSASGSLAINTLKGGDDLLNIGKGAWSSIKNSAPAIQQANAVLQGVKSAGGTGINAIRHPLQTLEAGLEAGKTLYQGGKSKVGEFFEGGARAALGRSVESAKGVGTRTWEFTKERLNPFNYEVDDVWNIKLSKQENAYEMIFRGGKDSLRASSKIKGGPNSIKNLKMSLGRAGIDTNSYDLRLVSATELAEAQRNNPGQILYGWIQRDGAGELIRNKKGKPIINFTNDTLKSWEHSVTTFGHEERHIKDAIAGLSVLDEDVAEEAGKAMWKSFLKARRRK